MSDAIEQTTFSLIIERDQLNQVVTDLKKLDVTIAEQKESQEKPIGTRVVEPLSALVVLTVIMGAAVLGKYISDMALGGTIIDARVSPVTVERSKGIPGGTLIVITAEGKSEYHNVSEIKINEIFEALSKGINPPAADA